MSSGRRMQAIGVTIALVFSTAWVYGCNVTADDQRQAASDDRTQDDQRQDVSSDRGESFFDRLLGDRTRAVTVPAGTTVRLRWSETVSSRASSVGDAFRTTVDEDVRIADAVAIPRTRGNRPARGSTRSNSVQSDTGGAR